jgi:hypothetical protein
MYRKKDPPDFLPARKDMKVVATLVDDVSGTKVHIGLVDSCYEILLEPPHPGGEARLSNVSRLNTEIFRELKNLPLPK